MTAAQFRNLSGPQALQLYVSSLEKANLSQSQFTFFLEAIASDSSRLLPLLRDGGRLGAIVGSDPVMRFTVVQRKGDRFETTSPWDTIAPRLVNFPEPSSFSF